MKGFIKQAAVLTCFSAALFAVLGCEHYRTLVDPCYPERYNAQARQSVRDMHNAQSAQGHKLDQTIWNNHFEKDANTGEGSAVLNEAGKELLRQIARRQPWPDHQLWLQFGHDVKEPNRRNVTTLREVAIRNFLEANTQHANGKAYNIEIHDLIQPTYQSTWTQGALDNVEKGIKGGKWLEFPQSSGSSSSSSK